MMNRGMAEDVLRTEDLSEMLARDAVERVAGEVTATAPTRKARDADELYELIKSHGALGDDEIGERTAVRGSDLVRELAGGGRIAPIHLTHRRSAGLDRRRGLPAVQRGISGRRTDRVKRGFQWRWP